jgi:hypothetical protein
MDSVAVRPEQERSDLFNGLQKEMYAFCQGVTARVPDAKIDFGTSCPKAFAGYAKGVDGKMWERNAVGDSITFTIKVSLPVAKAEAVA